MSDQIKTTPKSTKKAVFYNSARIVLLFTGIIGLWYFLGMKWNKTFHTAELAGLYGDSFGFVNSLFSGLAFGGVIIAIVLQTQELKLQRQEMKETRDELEKSATAQSELVRLNTLTALTQYYLTGAAQSDERIDVTYANALRFYPDTIESTIKFKLNNCAILLEKLYGEITNQPMGDAEPNSVPKDRKRHWKNYFVRGWSQHKRVWEEWRDKSSDTGFRTVPLEDVVTYLKSWRDGLQQDLDCIDSLYEEGSIYMDRIKAIIPKIDNLIVDLGKSLVLGTIHWKEGHELIESLEDLIERAKK